MDRELRTENLPQKGTEEKASSLRQLRTENLPQKGTEEKTSALRQLRTEMIPQKGAEEKSSVQRQLRTEMIPQKESEEKMSVQQQEPLSQKKTTVNRVEQIHPVRTTEGEAELGQVTETEKEKEADENKFIMLGRANVTEETKAIIPEIQVKEKPRYSGYLTLGIKEHIERYGGDLSKLQSGEIPREMKCLMLSSFGRPENVHVEKVPIFLPTKGQVLIKVYSCGMSGQDTLTRGGYLEHAPKTPFILGGEVAGEIVGLGDKVNDFKIGDRIVALPEFNGWCQYVTCPASVCFKLPADMTYHEAVALASNGLTAYSLLFELGAHHSGKSILYHPVPGALGSILRQMAHSVSNVMVFTNDVRRDEELATSDNDIFIEHGVDYAGEIRRVSAMGVDLIIDGQCGDNFHKNYNLLKPMGKYIIFGTPAENKSIFSAAKAWWGVEKISPLKLYEDNKSICGFNIRKLLYFQRERLYVKRIMHNVFKMWFEGKVKPQIDSVFAFEDYIEAVHRLEEHNELGKVILDPYLEKDSQEALEAKANIFERCQECPRGTPIHERSD